MANIAVWGAWHLGSVFAAGLAALNHKVLVTDLDSRNLESLIGGAAPVHEPGLDSLIQEQMSRGTLKPVKPSDPALGMAPFTIISADVPVDDEDKASLVGIDEIVAAIGGVLAVETTLIVMSQLPVGTSHRLARELASLARLPRIPVVCLPENLRLGSALEVFFKPDRLVIGADEEESAVKVKDLFGQIECPSITMSVRSAEMAKHALNAYLATCISFSSQISDLCEHLEADARDVVSAMRLDRRVSPKAPIAPGLGFGGGTLGRDVKYLIGASRKAEIPSELFDAVLEVNNRRLSALVDRIGRILGGLDGTTVGLLGLAYKPGTSTLRRSQSVELGRLLTEAGATVKGHDPVININQSHERGIVVFPDAYQAAADADVLVLMTEWPEYRNLDPHRLAGIMRRRNLIDPMGFLDSEALTAAGFDYRVAGKPDAVISKGQGDGN